MSAYRSQIQAVLAEVRPWLGRLLRSTYSDNVNIATDPARGSFSITAYWHTRDGKKGQYTKTYSPEYLFGASLHTAQPKVQRRVCFYMQEFMREVLNARGVNK